MPGPAFAQSRIKKQRATSTRAIVRLHNESFPNGAPIEYHTKGWKASSDELAGSVIGISTSKQIGSASGQFQIRVKRNQLVARQSLLRSIDDPEDTWCEIIAACDGQLIYTWLGLVDSIKESVTRKPDGSRDETYVITGQDLGKILDRTDIFINLFEKSGGAKRFAAIYNATNKRLEGNPAEFIHLLLDTWVHNQDISDQPWIVPKSLAGSRIPFSAMLRRFLIQDMDQGNGSAFDVSLLRVTNEGTNLWAMLEAYSNPLLNELWIDLVPPKTVVTETGGGLLAQVDNVTSVVGSDPITGGIPNLDGDPGGAGKFVRLPPAITLRERPFPSAKGGHARWDSLRTHELELQDVKAREISKGGAANRYNYWMLQLTSAQGSSWDSTAFMEASTIDGARQGHPGDVPIVNRDSIAKHGMRRWMGSTKFIPFLRVDNDEPKPPVGTTTDSIADLAANWLRKVHDWYAVAPFELSGTITTTRWFPEIRIGERVLERRDGEPAIMYYVEGVAHEWNYPGAGQTTLTVTRGEYEDDNLLERVYEEFRRGFAKPSEDVLFEQKFQEALSAFENPQNLTNADISTIPGSLGDEGGFGEDLSRQARNAKFRDDRPKPYPATNQETIQARRLAQGDASARVMPSAATVGPSGTMDSEALEAGFDVALPGEDGWSDEEVT